MLEVSITLKLSSQRYCLIAALNQQCTDRVSYTRRR